MDYRQSIHNTHYPVRIFIIYFLIISGFSIVLSKAFFLQVIKGRKYAQIARHQYSREVKLIPARGVIMDRDGRILTQSVLVDSFYMDPSQVRAKWRTASILEHVLGVSKEAVYKKMDEDRQFVWIKRLVDPEVGKKLMQYKLDGIYMLREYRRFYPNKNLASSVLGFVDIDSNGLAGMELSLNNYLNGKPYKAIIDVDGHNSPMYTNESFKSRATSGDDVVSTIDINIQFMLEQALSNAVSKYEAQKGIGIIMSPYTGEVLAMANIPDFNPNIYMNYPISAFKNISVEDSYEPGSIFKPFTISSAIDSGIISPTQDIFCDDGDYRVYNITIQDAGRSFGLLSVADIIKYSSNIGAAKIGEKVGPRILYTYLRRFGFGKQTGIELPGESSGILNPINKWSGVSVDTIPFGQGVSATPIQLAVAMCAIANGGILIKPTIVKEIMKPDGKAVTLPPVIRERVISRRTAHDMTNMLVRVVNDGGTGLNAKINGYTVAGKTGTAQIPVPKIGGYYKNRFITSFMGFIPAKHPRIVMLIMLIDPKKDQYGGDSAAPVFKEVAERVLPYLGVPSKLNLMATPSSNPSIPDINQIGEYISTQTGFVPDFIGKPIRAVLKQAKEAGIDNIIIKGTGYAVKQNPSPDSPYVKGAVVVNFSMRGNHGM